jgi:DNA-binding transcriptional LysR family regulator
MTNIPTELLRTLLAVVDLRSFTKAARALGVTQPAVSAQIKRLQSLLGLELFDKSAPGVSVTETGKRVVGEARRLLAINDQIVTLARAPHAGRVLRFGLPGDLIGIPLWQRLVDFRTRWPDIRLDMKTGNGPELLEELNQGELDVAVTIANGKPAQAAAHHWRDEMVWIRGAGATLDSTQPIRLLTRGEHCIFHQHMVTSLEAAGRAYEIVLTSAEVDDLTQAVAAGLGVTALPRALARSTGARICEDAALPKLVDLECSIWVRPDSDPLVTDDLAGLLAEALRPAPQMPLGSRAERIAGVQPATRRIPAA